MPGAVIRHRRSGCDRLARNREVGGAGSTDDVVCAVFTTWVTGGAEIDPSKFPSPE